LNIIEIKEELLSVVKGNTVDAMIPPFVYIVANLFLDLKSASALAVATALLLVGIRLKTKKSWKYAFSGFLGVAIATAFALFADNATNYYFPKLISSIGLIFITGLSLLIKKPLAAWLSHFSRGWPLDWFWRADVRPAYTEVTLFWLGLFSMRAVLQFTLFFSDNVAGLFLFNTLLGLPFTLLVLIISYIYGVWRLKRLGGPSIEEDRQNLPKPWKGQTRGF
jgi:hypothetical protein